MSGRLEPAWEPPQDRKRLLNSPGHSVLSPNLLQSFPREVGSFRWVSCRLRELSFARACFPSELFQLPTAPQLERRAHCVPPRAREQRNPGGRGGSARGLGRSGARGARSTRSARSGAGPAETGWAPLGPHPARCRFAAPQHPTAQLDGVPVVGPACVFGGLVLRKCSVSWRAFFLRVG